MYDGNARGEVPGEHQNWMNAHTFGGDLEEFYIKTNYIIIIILCIEYIEPTDLSNNVITLVYILDSIT